MAMLSVRTRRHLLKLAAAGSAMIPIAALTTNSAEAGDKENGRLNDDHDRNNFSRAWDKYSRDRDCDPSPNCFLKGTRIGTPCGEMPVEQLKIGDEVSTLDGIRKIKWIGYNKFRSSTEAIEGVTPVKVTRFALDDSTPVRDLYLSPGHCLFVEGVLIPVEYLINEQSVSYDTRCDREWIEYYHIEFEGHEVIFAEGATVESYCGAERSKFQNQEEYLRLYGGAPNKKAPYAPIMGYYGGFSELDGLIRSIISTIVDVRNPIQIVGDRIDDRAQALRF
jgi:hypothetical protein